MSRLRLLAAAGVLAAASVSVLAPAMAQERSSPTRPPSGGQVPSGSYLQTCRGANMNGNMLSAQCTGPTGAPVFSSIDTNGCRGRDIANDRGYLRCNSGGGPRPPAPGNFSVTVYTGANYTGRSMSIRTAVANFGNFPGFNDNIRSIRVHSGRVQACADSRYNGRCVTIGQSYRDLNAIRMANQISSIR
jgi:hypothetical protein